MGIKCDFCDKESIIGYQNITGVVQVCNYHYKVKVAEEIEASEAVKPICDLCRTGGEMYYNGLLAVGDKVIVNFICINCMNTKSEKKSFDGYFKKR